MVLGSDCAHVRMVLGSDCAHVRMVLGCDCAHVRMVLDSDCVHVTMAQLNSAAAKVAAEKAAAEKAAEEKAVAEKSPPTTKTAIGAGNEEHCCECGVSAVGVKPIKGLYYCGGVDNKGMNICLKRPGRTGK